MNLLTNSESFNELRRDYSTFFSLGNINGYKDHSPIESRFILISLICHVTYKTKLKNPDTTHYMIVSKLSQNLGLPDDFIKGLSIVCEDFSYNCSEFPTFGLSGKDIISEIRGILSSYLPF